jgi:hypothetical protein
MEMTSDFGTNEMRRHHRTRIEPRGVSNGGRVITVGLTNETPDLLEVLYVDGKLQGPDEDEVCEHRRVCNGRAFQELYASWKYHGRDPAAAENTYRMMITLEGHVGSERDLLETIYHETMNLLGMRNANIAHGVCLSGSISGFSLKEIRNVLDVIPRVMEDAEYRVSARNKINILRKV